MTGYWQIELDHESSLLCIFNMPWGRYHYMRLPFGIKTARNIFMQEINKLFGDLEGVGIVTDDILVYGSTIEEHDKRLKAVLDRACYVHLKLNDNKSCIFQTSVKYVGHVLRHNGIMPDPRACTGHTRQFEQKKSFKELKNKLRTAPVLAYYAVHKHHNASR